MTLLESRKPNDLLFPANHFSYHSLLDLESNNSSFPLTLANFLPYLLLDQIQIACSGVLFFFLWELIEILFELGVLIRDSSMATPTLIELKYKLPDGNDIGPNKYTAVATVATLKEYVIYQ